MSTLVRLDNVEHATLKLRRGHGVRFGEAVNQVAVVASEFDRVQREYPILFARTEDKSLQGVAILGFDRDENLFLDGERWDAAYIPALLRRGPFALGLADGEPAIHVDLSHPRIAAEDEDGALVFKPHGGETPELEAATDALRVLSAGAAAIAAMTELFDELALVEPVRLQVRIADDASVDFDGYMAITRETIARLDGGALARLNAAGLLDVAIFAAASLGTIPQLIARKRRKLSAAP